MKKNLFCIWLVLLAVLFSVNMEAQMTIGGKKVPEAFSVLELLNKGGLRLPQMTTAERDAFAVQGNDNGSGLVIYNKTTGCVEYWNKTRWVSLCDDTSVSALIAAENGLTVSSGKAQLGGALLKPTTLTTTSAYTLAIQGLQAGAAADKILVADANGVLKWIDRSAIQGDNLGNHTATQNLVMSGNDITDAGTVNAINANVTVKTTTASAQITKGTDGAAPKAGDIAMAADANGNVIWVSPQNNPGAIAGVYEFLGTNQISVAAGVTTAVPMTGNSFTLTHSAKVLITYSLLPLPASGGAPTQGSIDLIVDNVKQISSYYSAADAPSALSRLGNYSTAQKIISLAAGTHTVGLNLKSWSATTMTNVNPVPGGYVGAMASDSQAMVARITICVFND